MSGYNAFMALDMKFRLNTLPLFTLALVLGGCSYWVTEPEVSGDAEQIDLTQQQRVVPSRDIGQVVYESSNGSVQLFSLDNDAGFNPDYKMPEQQPAQQWRSEGPFINGSLTPLSSEDPSVEIYGFDDVVYAEPAAAKAPAVKKPQYEVQGQDTVVVYFGHDSVALNTDSGDKIADVARAFNAGEMGPITVEGHASVRANYPNETTRKAVNLRISMNRAFIVAKALMDQGVPAEAIKLVARGDTIPPTELGGKTQEEASRRVEISD